VLKNLLLLGQLLIKENSCSRMFLCESLIFHEQAAVDAKATLKIKRTKTHQTR
jgi:hypothetical protein